MCIDNFLSQLGARASIAQWEEEPVCWGGDCRRGITVWPADFYLPRFWANMIPDRIGYANIR